MRQFELYVKDILIAIERIQKYTKNLEFLDFTANQMIIDATTRNLEIIGEAISQVPESVKSQHKNIPWQRIKDFRNLVIHRYFTVDVKTLWEIIQHKLEPLKEQLEKIK